MEIQSLLAFALLCFVMVIVPGPTVSVIIANSLRFGASAGMLNVLGTQFGVLLMLLVVALGLETVMAVMANWFFLFKIAGALYLIYLGIKLWSDTGSLEVERVKQRPKRGFFWQGFLVIWSNPKALFLFGAIIPQFVTANAMALTQTIIYGVIFIVIASVFDSAYALAAGQMRQFVTEGRAQMLGKISGVLLIGGGVWMAFSRQQG